MCTIMAGSLKEYAMFEEVPRYVFQPPPYQEIVPSIIYQPGDYLGGYRLTGTREGPGLSAQSLR